MIIPSTPLDLVLGADQARAFIYARAHELTREDLLPEPVALQLTVGRVLHGDPVTLAEPGQVWTLRAGIDPDDAPAHRLAIHARLQFPPRVMVADLDDPTGEVDELLLEVLELYQLATWYPTFTVCDG
ncbi:MULTISPECIES: hypothetical protein [Streptomyces]|uniref:hypothetical protein n=1 Tax=Streptomyces TaxID=1883 RepID=UPI000F657B0D|nr:hypothetical protein [Streptomyces alboflavus]